MRARALSIAREKEWRAHPLPAAAPTVPEASASIIRRVIMPMISADIPTMPRGIVSITGIISG
ncbi:hypothetical protein GCM10007920_18290 [Ciceribacter naphthalenivorans]|uniref:Uncharacterized protein n=2 Tax=Alphaproteobacteria TaxID=28211 RepID=A0A512HJH8_9HYPH|nr:hypothetical protein RNA01_25350 [Ciceribacter naphthalenivorans]GLR22042.1 hypothetical protein GCM10007920_18290 [Ciceribacter naphthalenivorans]GLT04898.1 hypothetical protein GCM10007926_18290 [Sphingomonas psychrolutea]